MQSMTAAEVEALADQVADWGSAQVAAPPRLWLAQPQRALFSATVQLRPVDVRGGRELDARLVRPCAVMSL